MYYNFSAYEMHEDIKDLETSRYFYFWKAMLRKLFGLPEQSVCNWAVRYRKELFADRSVQPCHIHPIDAIKHLFVTRDLLKKRKFKYYPFIKEIIERVVKLGYPEDINYDYDAIKQIIVRELEKHNAELPKISKDNLTTRDEWHKSLSEEMLSQYIPFWKKYFREIFGSLERTGRLWSLRHQITLESGSIIAYENGPAYYIIDLTIPDELIYRMDINWFAFRDQVYEIIDDNGNCRAPNYDFRKIKKRLTEFFSEYNATINRPSTIAVTDKPYLTSKHCVPFVLRFMANLLSEVLGCSKEQILEKAKSSFDELHVEIPLPEREMHFEMFFQDAGRNCAERILFDEIFGSEFADSFSNHELIRRITEAISVESGEHNRPEYTPDYDFVKVGEIIKHLIRHYKEGC